jgi:NADH:ubiquinone oxidoreductase subunit B-like Fe-S oxidoreductase
MFPFRELEVYDLFLMNGVECEKVGNTKYLVYDEMLEPEELLEADPNMMVELLEDLVE